jgi:hypothetical protein
LEDREGQVVLVEADFGQQGFVEVLQVPHDIVVRAVLRDVVPRLALPLIMVDRGSSSQQIAASLLFHFLVFLVRLGVDWCRR